MRITVKYHTSDGMIFDTLEEAKAHEAVAESFAALVDELHKLLSHYGSSIDARSVARTVARSIVAKFTITCKPEQST